jgi:hypothetical protein
MSPLACKKTERVSSPTVHRPVPVAPLAGKVVLDTTNYYPERDGQIAELDSEETTITTRERARTPRRCARPWPRSSAAEERPSWPEKPYPYRSSSLGLEQGSGSDDLGVIGAWGQGLLVVRRC